ncbi:MAG: DUF924 family protein [Beijerinckiaceae bacterium]
MDDLAAEIVAFWREAGPEKWFAKDEAFDESIRTRFSKAHRDASRGRFAHWEHEAESVLALLLLIDQFPRNLFRDSAHAFATDAMALNVAKRALRNGFDAQCGEKIKPFFYLPLMHSEDIADQELCLALCLQTGAAETIKFARIHRDIIARFKRFPHRNIVFGRDTTPEEQAFLDAGGFAG